MTVRIPFTDYPIKDSRFHRAVELVGGGTPVKVIRTGEAPGRECYLNVQQRCASNGGKPAYGWLVTWLPEVYIHAMHHAVWCDPKGKLIDITAPQAPGAPKRGLTSFIRQDEKLKTPFNPNRYLLLVDDADIEEAITAYTDNFWVWKELQVLKQRHDQLLRLVNSPLAPGASAHDRNQRIAFLDARMKETETREQAALGRVFARYCESPAQVPS